MSEWGGGGMRNIFWPPEELYTFLEKEQIQLIPSISEVDSEIHNVVLGALESVPESFDFKSNISFYTHHGMIKAYQAVGLGSKRDQ